MIQNGFLYFSTLVFLTAILVSLPQIFSGKTAKRIFRFAPPVVLIYLGMMFLCTVHFWNLDSTKNVYVQLKNPLLYAMLFIMLLRCDMKIIIKLGPRMLLGFLAATLSIGLGFVISYALFQPLLGNEAWKSLGALCGSWMGGGGNMLAIQAALQVDEGSMAYALVIDSICGTVYIMFLLWAIGRADHFNRWTKADTRLIDSVGHSLRQAAAENEKKFTWQNLLILLGCGFLVSALSEHVGAFINKYISFLDQTTWTVLVVTLLGILFAMTPLGRLKGTEELSNVMLYIVIAMLASRADLSAIGNAPAWLLCGLVILAIHIIIMIAIAKLCRMDLFTCCVASLANVGGTATAPVLAGAYSNYLVPVGIIMALLGYVVGTGGGLFVARLMSLVG